MITLEVGIVSDDAAGLAAFYRDGFGFTVERVLQFPQGTVHRLRRDDACCKIYQPAEGAADRPAAEPWHANAGICYAALHVDDASAEVARAVRAGGSVLVPLSNHRPGAWFALVADPDGNVWEVLQEADQV
ncbi:MAG: Glyoxalase/bleomycin resistance protein/dioxygenase [Ilumatobacteraceae bacterium]|nr:Glyoxalase/bleomycin resistance protein/dioxygenase [Ilumatobacteraceae bacterium]